MAPVLVTLGRAPSGVGDDGRPAHARQLRRLRDGGPHRPGPAGERGRGAHADAAARRALRRAGGDAVARPAALLPGCGDDRRRHARVHRRAGHRAPARGRAAGARARGGRRPAAASWRAAGQHAGGLARAARHRRLDDAVAGVARAGLARRLPGHRHRLAEGARIRAGARRAAGAGAGRKLAPLALLCRHRAVAGAGIQRHARPRHRDATDVASRATKAVAIGRKTSATTRRKAIAEESR